MKHTASTSKSTPPFVWAKGTVFSPEKWKQQLPLLVRHLAEHSSIDDRQLWSDLQHLSARLDIKAFICEPHHPQQEDLKLSSKRSDRTNGSTLTKSDSKIISQRSYDKSLFKSRAANNTTLHSFSSFLHSSFRSALGSDAEKLTEILKKPTCFFECIIEEALFIMEVNFKQALANNSEREEDIDHLITNVIEALKEILTWGAYPLLEIYPQLKVAVAIGEHIHEHVAIQNSIRKVKRYQYRQSQELAKKIERLPDVTSISIESHQLPKELHEVQCYVRTMNGLIQFSEVRTGAEALAKLEELREALLQDVENFYIEAENKRQQQKKTEQKQPISVVEGDKKPESSSSQFDSPIKRFSNEQQPAGSSESVSIKLIEQKPKNSKIHVSAADQFEILRFTLHKVKDWIPQLLAQTEFIKMTYDENDLNNNFGLCGYIWVQLTQAIQTVIDQE